MKVLVTGATGFIGNHLVMTLLERGHEVVACSRSPELARAFSWFKDVTYLQVDISKLGGNIYERAGSPEALIHAAWDRLDNYRDIVHFETALMHHYNFIRELVRAGLPQCAVLGSCLEYGLQEGALREDMEAKPILAYPLAKHLLRQLLEGLQAHYNFKLQWLRLFYVYGPGQRQSSLLSQLDAALVSGHKCFDMSPGDQLRDYLPVKEMARIICGVSEQKEFDGIVNCCSGRPISVIDLVQRTLEERGATIDLNRSKYPYPDYEPRAFWGDRCRLNWLLETESEKSRPPS